MPLERLQKIIASSGVTSRRKAEELITTGAVSVNGEVVSTLGSKADISKDEITVSGKPLSTSRQHYYLVMHKPKGYVTTVDDPEGRDTVMSLLPPDLPRVYPVGRLDYLTEGLLIFTNDGDLAYKLTQASSHVPKTYLVKVAGEPTEQDIERLRGGVHIEKTNQQGKGPRVKTSPAQIRWVRHADNPWLEVTLIEGRNRQVRKMFEEVGHHVEKIRRIAYGPLTLDLATGALRSLKIREVLALKQEVGMAPKPKSAADKAIDPRSTEAGKRKAMHLPAISAAMDADRPKRRPPTSATRPDREGSARPPRRDYKPRPTSGEGRPARPYASRDRETSARPPRRDFKPRTNSDRPNSDKGRPSRPPYSRDRADSGSRPPRRDYKPRPTSGEDRPARPYAARDRNETSARPPRRDFRGDSRPERSEPSKERATRPPRRDFRPGQSATERRPAFSRNRPGSDARPPRRDFKPRPQTDRENAGAAPQRPSRASPSRPSSRKPFAAKSAGRPAKRSRPNDRPRS